MFEKIIGFMKNATLEDYCIIGITIIICVVICGNGKFDKK